MSLFSLQNFDAKMTPEQCLVWLQQKYNRRPEPIDLFNAGKTLFRMGAFLAASKVLQLYVDSNGSEMPGRHLLGYAYYMTGQKVAAVEQLQKCVNSGFDQDWQLLVELLVDVDRSQISQTAISKSSTLSLSSSSSSSSVYIPPLIAPSLSPSDEFSTINISFPAFSSSSSSPTPVPSDHFSSTVSMQAPMFSPSFVSTRTADTSSVSQSLDSKNNSALMTQILTELSSSSSSSVSSSSNSLPSQSYAISSKSEEVQSSPAFSISSVPIENTDSHEADASTSMI
eukprot:TRINITY_DN10479_c0_g1_i1.p1 TRINITY_DN10479_c0_g1~~TRINITY_DN10479_c0_g1_i1.p1  ORF type:complete len:283 (+),score=68.78 TRINITY_DN10479_c0_g1_i1:115-963(+)